MLIIGVFARRSIAIGIKQLAGGAANVVADGQVVLPLDRLLRKGHFVLRVVDLVDGGRNDRTARAGETHDVGQGEGAVEHRIVECEFYRSGREYGRKRFIDDPECVVERERFDRDWIAQNKGFERDAGLRKRDTLCAMVSRRAAALWEGTASTVLEIRHTVDNRRVHLEAASAEHAVGAPFAEVPDI